MKPLFHKKIAIRIDFAHLDPETFKYLRQHIQESEHKDHIKTHISDESAQKYNGNFMVTSQQAAEFLDDCLEGIFGV